MVASNKIVSKIADTLTATIAISTTTSAAVDLGGASMAGLIMPAAFTGTTISFTVSDTLDGTYVALKNTAGTTISFTVAASTAIGFAPNDFAAWRYIKIVSGSTELAGRAIKIIPRIA